MKNCRWCSWLSSFPKEEVREFSFSSSGYTTRELAPTGIFRHNMSSSCLLRDLFSVSILVILSRYCYYMPPPSAPKICSGYVTEFQHIGRFTNNPFFVNFKTCDDTNRLLFMLIHTSLKLFDRDLAKQIY